METTMRCIEGEHYRCTREQCYEFVKTNNLIEHPVMMHTYWVDENDKVRAQMMHGFAFNEYSIDEPNFETQNLVGKWL